VQWGAGLEVRIGGKKGVVITNGPLEVELEEGVSFGCGFRGYESKRNRQV